MGRSPRDDFREGKFGDPVLQKRSLQLRRSEGPDAWRIAQQLGVSTSTVLQWWEALVRPAPEPAPEPAPRKKSAPRKKQDLVDDWRRRKIARGDHPVDRLVRRSQNRYAHQRKIRMAVADVPEAKRPPALIAATHTAVGVIVPRRQTKVLPKQVPWMEEW